MNEVKRLFLLGSSLLLLAGCAQQRQFKAVEQICVPNVQKQQAMQVAEDVLRRMHFTISKADAEQGIIRTRPLPGAQYFEFWRSDNVGTENSVEANLHSLRRAAELNLTEQNAQLCIGCDVKVQRLSLPEFEVSSSSRAYEMFSRSTAKMQELRLRREQEKEMEWLDMGQDTRLSTEILKRIEAKLKVKNEN
ncbi:MAG: hypothetical protein ACYSTG_00055 [Planctomycetota bacterium]|jgi:hypothetical protein